MRKTVFLAAVLWAQTAYAGPELKGTPSQLKHFLYPDQKTISISGYAEETAYADKAVVSLIIRSKDKKMSDAMARNTQLRESIKRELVESGIPPSNINNSKFSQSPQYGWFGKKPSAYEAINRLSIEITEEKNLKEIARIADENTDITMADISFKHSKKKQFEQDVKTQSLEDVKAQKAQYENALGLTLTPTSIDELQTYNSATQGAKVIEEAVVEEVAVYAKGSKPKAYSRQPKAVEATFEEIQYSARLVVQYAVEEK